MAQHKVIQDIEAEDKLIGPLTLKQFIYFAITAVCLYLIFFTFTQGAAFFAIFLLPPAVFFGVLGFPWSKAQPTETWLLAKIRFFFKPRKRIWDQAGIKELVTITVPKKVERHLTDELDQTQVRSRLSALAQTVDSRGWAVKQLGGSPFGGQQVDNSDRLVAGTETVGTQIATDVGVKEDVLDENNNPTAKNIDKMITQSEATHKDQIKQRMSHPQAAPQENQQNQQTPQDFWFMHQNDPSKTPPGMATGQGTTVAPHTDDKPEPGEQNLSKADEEALLNKIHDSQAKKSTYTTHQKTVLPLSEQKKQKDAAPSTPHQQPTNQKEPAKPEPKKPDPSVTQLANNNDLNVETIARQANKNKDDDHPDEVVVSLH
ncbi:MAG: PrgI family protein [Candidatus Saccharibacteria bacterium]|nr:PrgI family protein [Candidatus Saccharibacteria bacterium]